MSMMIAEIYEALVEAGTSEEKAKAAASVVPAIDNLATKTDLNTQRNLRAEMQAQQEAIISLLERMAHLEGLLEGLREAITGRRVAEETGKYNTR